MATTVLIKRRGFTNAIEHSMARPAALALFQQLKDTQGLETLAVYNNQGAQVKYWDCYRGEVIVAEPLPPRAANSVHNRRRRTA